MTNLLDIIRGRGDDRPISARWSGISVGDWLEMFQAGYFFQQTLPGSDHEDPPVGFSQYATEIYQGNSIVFSCLDLRQQIFAEARFAFQRMRDGRPGELFSSRDLLAHLETPWSGGTTGDLLARMEQDASLAGNSYTLKLPGNRLFRMRPDWVTVVIGSHNDKGVGAWDVGSEVIGYLYHPGGPTSGNKPIPYLTNAVAHYKPIPDPTAQFRGMSWIQPILLEVMGDKAATKHKLAFFENGATPNVMVKLAPEIKPEEYKEWREIFREEYTGVANAYETMFLGGGADATVIGADMRQLDFKATVGVAETRIAAAAGTPAVLVGLSEGLQGSSLNEGNYGQARRRFSDGKMRPLWRCAAGAMSAITKVPSDARLWYDDRDIPFLQDDRKAIAESMQVEAATMSSLINAGYEPESVTQAIQSNDWSLLIHTGLIPVQLQSGDTPPDPAPASD